MSSTSPVPLGGGQRQIAEAKLQVGYSQYNKQTKQWIPLALGDQEKEQIEARVQEIETIGKQTSGVLRQISADPGRIGNKLEIIGERIIRHEGQKEINILDDKTASKEGKREVLRKIKDVSNILRPQGNVKVELEVVPTTSTQSFEQVYAQEYAAYESIPQMRNQIESHREELIEKYAYTDREIDEILEKLDVLETHLGNFLQVLDGANESLRAGLDSDAVNYLNQYFADYFTSYLDGLKDMVIPIRVMTERMGAKTLLPFDLQGIRIYETLFKKVRTDFENHPQEELRELADSFNNLSLNAQTQVRELENTIKRSKAEQHILEFRDRRLQNYKDLSDFVHLIKGHEGELHKFLKQEGISLSEWNYIMKAMEDSLPIMQVMLTESNRIVDLVNHGEIQEAVKALNDLMQNHFETYARALSVMRQMNPFIQSHGDKLTRIEKQITAREQGIKLSQKISFNDRWSSFWQPVDSAVLQFKEIVEELEFPEGTETFQKMRETGFSIQEEIDSYLDQEAKLTKQVLVKEKEYIQDKRLEFALKTNQLTIEDLKAFAEISNAYAREIEPLQKGFEASQTESDPIKKRTLQLQLEKEAQETIPRLNKIREKYLKWGGAEKYSLLQESLKAYQMHLEAGIMQFIGERPGGTNLLEALSHARTQATMGAISRTENALKTAETDAKRLSANQDVLLAVNSFYEKGSFLDSLFDSTHIKMEWDEKIIENVLLRGNFTSDPDWREACKDAGLNPKDFATLADLYGRLGKCMEPVYLAQGRLNDDPFNPKLQKDLRKAFDAAIPKARAILKEFNGWKGKEKLKSLTQATQAFREVLQDRLQTETRESQIKNIQKSLNQLNRENFEEVMTSRFTFFAEVGNRLQFPQSSEEGFMESQLLSPPSKDYVANRKWDSLLKEQGITKKELTWIGGVFQKLQRILQPLLVLRQEADLDPGNLKKQQELFFAMVKKNKELKDLQNEATVMETQQWMEKIQVAREKYSQYLHKQLEAAEAMHLSTDSIKEEIARFQQFNLDKAMQEPLWLLERSVETLDHVLKSK